MIKLTPCFIALTLSTAAVSSSAMAETELHPIVTASRIAQTADQAMTAVTVITREDIKGSQSQSVSEILRDRVPGMDFLTTGGTGHQVSTFLRGTSSDQVLLIIDGNVIGSASTGAAQIELIPLEQIERIEVIRGPRSSLYGSQAIGGVIQLFTRAGTDSTSASVTLGSNNTHAASAGLGIGDENTQFDIFARHYKTDGFDATNDGEADDDGHTNDSINLNFSHNLSKSTNIHAQFLHSDSNTEFDNISFDNESDSIQQSYTIGIDSALNETWRTSLNMGQSKDRLDTLRHYEDFFSPGTYIQESTLFETRREQARWQNEIAIRETGQIAFGIDYLNDILESTTMYSETERSDKALYALFQEKYGRHQIQVSGRVDDNSSFGTHRTANAAWSYDITGDLLISLSHGTAFIAPTFNELYFVDPFFNGNPDLQPETSRSTELGIGGTHSWGQWDIRTYHTEIENLIVGDGAFPASVVNSDQAEIDGIEFEGSGTLLGWRTNASLALLDAEDISNNKPLRNRAEETFKLNISKDINDISVALDILAQGDRYIEYIDPNTFANVTGQLPGYGIVNLRLVKPINKNWSLESKIENLFDKAYATSTDFFGNTANNTPISLFVTLSYLN